MRVRFESSHVLHTPQQVSLVCGTLRKAGNCRAARKLEGDLRPVFFGFDKYDLSQESRDTLTANARLLRDSPAFNIWIEGHCDERGTNEYNLALGDRRARAARDFLVAAGVAANRMTVISYGEEHPFAMGHDESAWSQNRRAHFKVKGRGIGG